MQGKLGSSFHRKPPIMYIPSKKSVLTSVFDNKEQINNRLIELERLEKLSKSPKILKLKLPYIKD